MSALQIAALVLGLVEVVMRALGYKDADIGDILLGVKAKLPDEIEKLQKANHPNVSELEEELRRELGVSEPPRRDAGGFAAPDPREAITEAPPPAPPTLPPGAPQ